MTTLGVIVFVIGFIFIWCLLQGNWFGAIATIGLPILFVWLCIWVGKPKDSAEKEQETPDDSKMKPISLSSEPPLDIEQKADEFVARGVPSDAVANFRDGYVTAEEIERCILSGDFKIASSSFGGNPYLIHSQERERRKAKRFYPVAQTATNNSHSNPKTLIPESTPSSQRELKERLLAKHGHPPKKRIL